MSLPRTLTASASALILAACAVGPHYQAPSLAPVALTTLDPHLAAAPQPPPAGWWRAFGDPNPNGGRDMEMFLTPDQTRTLSIRVSSYSKADTGAYSLVVEPCRITTFDASATAHDNIDLGRGCRAESVDFANGAPMKVSFFSFPTDANVTDSVVIDRTQGTGAFYSYVAGPGLDLDCWGGDCSSNGGNSFDAAVKYRIIPDLPGRFTILAGVRADSAATVSIRVVTTPPAQPGAPAPTTPLARGGR